MAEKKTTTKTATKTATKKAANDIIRAVGRRKTASARVRLIPGGKGEITVNGQPYDQYFGIFELRKAITDPLKFAGKENFFDVSAKVAGGGPRGQAEAIRHGISRALVKWNEEFRKTLKAEGFLRRDPRAKERKKPGLKKARRAPQWSKR